jgi:tetratricopeptide (TPR) repeat protein
MRNVLYALMPLLIVAIAGLPAALADDEPSPPAPEAKPAEPPPAVSKPDPAIALFIGESLMPGEKDAPEGWTAVDEEADGGPTEDALNELAESLDLSEDVFYAQIQGWEKGGETVTVAMVDVDAKVYAYKHALAAKAAASGWQLAELGHPGRILVLGGPAGGVADLGKKLREHTIYKLSDMGMNRLRAVRHGDAGREAALTYAKYVDSLVPDTGTALALRGVVHELNSRPKEHKEKPNREEQEKAIAFFERSLADGVPFPPKGSVRPYVAGKMGGIILTWKDRTKLPQATKALEIAVEYESDAKSVQQRYGNRYDLSCAYARANRIDDAFEMLEKALEILKNMPAEYWRAQYTHIEEKDPDMGPLRQTEGRFTGLLAKFKPPEKKKRPMPKGHPPVPDNPHK